MGDESDMSEDRGKHTRKHYNSSAEEQEVALKGGHSMDGNDLASSRISPVDRGKRDAIRTAAAIGTIALVSFAGVPGLAAGLPRHEIIPLEFILPNLSSDPLFPEPGQMWYRTDLGVAAYYDAVKKANIYLTEYSNTIPSTVAKEVEVTVSSKGIVNGLSTVANDGADFGPDTLLDSTSRGQYGPPFTQTSGIQEAYNYAISNLKNIKLLSGTFLIDAPIEIGSQIGLTQEQQNINILGAGYNYGPGGGSTTIQISDNFNVSNNNYMIQIGVPSSVTSNSGTWQFMGSFGNIVLAGVSPNGENQVNIGIYINNLFNSEIYNISNPVNYNPLQYLIFQRGFNSYTGNAPIIRNITSYGAYGLHFEPNAQCLYDNITVLAYGYYDSSTNTVYTFEVGCTNNGGDSGPLMSNVNLWVPDSRNDQCSAIKLLGGASAATNISNITIHNPGYPNFPIIDVSDTITGIDSATTANGMFLISNLTAEYPGVGGGPLIKWGNNTNTGVNLLINGINIAYSNTAFGNNNPILQNTSGNTTPFAINVNGGLIVTANTVPALTSNPLASGQIFELSDIAYSNGLNDVMVVALAGTTAGSMTAKVLDYSYKYKKIMIYADGYENDTTTNQTLTYPITFSTVAQITANTTGMTVSTSPSALTITAPNNTTAYSGIIVIEGY